MTDFLTYVSTPSREILQRNSYLPASVTSWEDVQLTIANLENENALLRTKNAELAVKLNAQRGKTPGAPQVDPQELMQLQRQCRNLEDYINELEERKGMVDGRLLEVEKKKIADLTSRLGLVEGNNERLLAENSTLEKENLEMRDTSNGLRKELEETKEKLTQTQNSLTTTTQKLESTEAERETLRRTLKEVEDREVKHLEVQKQLTHRAETAQKELDAVYKWYGKRKCQCMKKKNAPEPWKKEM